MVSLFPRKTWKNRRLARGHGADARGRKPGFMRFPAAASSGATCTNVTNGRHYWAVAERRLIINRWNFEFNIGYT
jgi:hypothetical protein